MYQVPVTVCYSYFGLMNSDMILVLVEMGLRAQVGFVMQFFQLEKAYDKVMMAQLSNRKKGVTFGSFQVNFAILCFALVDFIFSF